MKKFEGDIVQVKKYKCPCCSYYTLMGWPFEICNVCFWECSGIEDDNQRYEPYQLDGVNSVTLIEGKINFKQCGVCDKQWKKYVRPPNENELKTPNKKECDFIIDEVEFPTYSEIIYKLQSIIGEISTRESVAHWAEEYLNYGISNIKTPLKDILKELIYIDDAEEDGTYCYDNNYIQRLIEKIRYSMEEGDNQGSLNKEHNNKSWSYE